MISLGKQIKVMRIVRGLRQGECADLIGICQPTLCSFETDKAEPCARTLQRIKESLDWPAEEMAEAAFDVLAGNGVGNDRQPE